MFVSSVLFPVIDSTPRSWSRRRRRYRQNWLAKHCSKRAGDRTGDWRLAHDRHRHFLSDGWLFAFGRMHVRAFSEAWGLSAAAAAFGVVPHKSYM